MAMLNVRAGAPLQRHVEYGRHQLGVTGHDFADQHHRQSSAPRETQEKAKDEEGDTWLFDLKFTGLTQNLDQLYGSYRYFKSNCWVNSATQLVIFGSTL